MNEITHSPHDLLVFLGLDKEKINLNEYKCLDFNRE